MKPSILNPLDPGFSPESQQSCDISINQLEEKYCNSIDESERLEICDDARLQQYHDARRA
jgi:hypothetical protein